jgi:hypothetical protein
VSSYDGGDFDEWVRDSLFGDVSEEKVQLVMKLLEPHRESIEGSLEGFEPEEHSWRAYRNSLWDMIPDDVNKAVEVILGTPRTRFERI